MNNEKGISLIEVIASVVILSVAVFGICGLLTQSAKTTAHSKKVINSTYIAQEEMESIYALAEGEHSVKKLKENLEATGYSCTKNNVKTQCKKDTQFPNRYIELNIKHRGHGSKNDLTDIVLKIIEEPNKLKVQLQSTIKWMDSH